MEDCFSILFKIEDFGVSLLRFSSKSALSRLGKNILQSENFANLAKSRKSRTLKTLQNYAYAPHYLYNRVDDI